MEDWNSAGQTKELVFLNPEMGQVYPQETDRVSGHGRLEELVGTPSSAEARDSLSSICSILL